MDAPGGSAELIGAPAEAAPTADPGSRPRQDPVLGWRYWQVAPSGRLRSVTQRRIEWQPGRPMKAICVIAGHRAPDERCDCGVHGSTTFEALRQHGLCLAPEALVVGEVALWGRVIGDHEGWRGEYAEPVRLSVVRGLVSEEELATTVVRLTAYDVAVDTMALADAVTGVSAATLANQAMAARASRSRAD